jgi:hypothetical protein
LPISFWVNGVLLNIGLTALLFVIPWGELTPKSPKLTAAGIVLLWPLSAFLAGWQLLGIWRSANNYLRQGKSRIWSNLAKVAVVLSLAKTTVDFSTIGIPQVMQFSKIALGNDPLGTYEIRVLNDSELEMDGAIVFGLTDRVEAMLDSNPKIQSIRLNSSGGRISEARRLRDLIDARRLSTSTTSSCLSACTFAFVAGKSRLVARGASLGFHKYAYPGVHGRDLGAQYERDKQDWLARGVAQTMVERAFATPHNEMWQPTHQELLAWGVVTGYLPN